MPVLLPPPVGGPTGPGVPGAVLHDGQLQLGEITLGTTDEFGVEWVLESLTGWDDPASSMGSTEQRSADHGGWIGPAFYSSRLVEVTGSLIASDWAGASTALDRLWSAVPLSTPDWLYVAEGARTLCALVRQEADPLVTRTAGWARFSISLLAPDPRRYDTAVSTVSTGLPVTTGGLSVVNAMVVDDTFTVGDTSTSGVLTATNAGNFETRPTFTVAGPVPTGASITHMGSGKTLRIVDAIPAGRTLTIDTDKRRALLDGTASRVVTGTWFAYEPGDNNVAFSATTYNSSALLTSSHRSAWR